MIASCSGHVTATCLMKKAVRVLISRRLQLFSAPELISSCDISQPRSLLTHSPGVIFITTSMWTHINHSFIMPNFIINASPCTERFSSRLSVPWVSPRDRFPNLIIRPEMCVYNDEAVVRVTKHVVHVIAIEDYCKKFWLDFSKLENWTI